MIEPDAHPSLGAPFSFPANPLADLKYDQRPTARSTGCAAMSVSLWAFACILFVLLGAQAGVTAIGLRVVNLALSAPQGAALAVCLVFFCVAEGWLGFHRSWSPVTARRCFLAGYATAQPAVTCASLSVIALAPLFAAGFFLAPPRRLVVSYPSFNMGARAIWPRVQSGHR